MIEPPGRAGSLFGADLLLAPKRSNRLTFHADQTQTGGKGSFEEPERYPGSENSPLLQANMGHEGVFECV